MSGLTPMMRQYLGIKKEYPDAILFFRMGDFYEMFGDDAVVASKAMNIALTTRDKNSDNPVPMCGVPYHAIHGYLPKMIKNGHKVAICEQMEDPATTKGMVRREVVRVITPGTVTEPSLLEEGSFNFLAGISPSKRGFGLAVADLSTGLFKACEFVGETALKELENELDRINPKQILAPDGLEQTSPQLAKLIGANCPDTLEKLDRWIFGYENARRVLTEQFKVASLDGFGLESMTLAVGAAGAVAQYMLDTQKGAIGQINKLVAYNPTETMAMDPASRRNLEITQSMADNSRSGSLLGVMDRTKTAMGARTLKEWLIRPLVQVDQIKERLGTVSKFFDDENLREKMRAELAHVGDLERIAGRVCVKNCSPRDLRALQLSLAPLPGLKEFVGAIGSALSARWVDRWDSLEDASYLLARSIADEPPAFARDGGMIRPGFSGELDELNSIQADSRKTLARMEIEEKERTGLTSIRIKYNKVYGYFIEVSRRQADNAPDDWSRKQSLVNTERFISPRLKELEDKILNARDRAMSLEAELFESVRRQTSAHAGRVRDMAAIIGQIDALLALGAVARENGYVAPEVDESGEIEIKGGRHPALERIPAGERFVPNDALLDSAGHRLSIVTGPNMAGKSTYIRQVALICLMAQVGSFVPAQSARIGVVDRIFTRVGAQDHLQRGQSTFMVEMNETALILNNATSQSLIILDEIGRGTSTFDGISIAWAVAEYIHKLGARTLFATHYHELAELADSLDGVRNMSMAVREWNDEIIFLRKIVEEGADKSYGIQVARLAGLPDEVITRAGEILTQLETSGTDSSGHPKLKAKQAEQQIDPQTDLFAPRTSEVEEELRRIDLDNLTPISALNKLCELKKKLAP